MLFSLENLSVGYRKSAPILKQVNLDLKAGERIALLGANGSGKSTLMKTISGLMNPLFGKIILPKNTKMSLVPQMKNLKLEYPMSIYDSLALSQTSHKAFWKSWKPNSFEMDILKRTGVEEFKDLLLRECSGGQLQKFLIARSLISGANLIFMDEPMDALDQSSQMEIMNLFRDMQNNQPLGFFMITHNISKNWLHYFHKIYRIQSDRVVEDGL